MRHGNGMVVLLYCACCVVRFDERSFLAHHPALPCRDSAAERPVFLPSVRRRRHASARAALAAPERTAPALAPPRAHGGLPRRTLDGRAGAGQRRRAAAAVAGAQREPAAVDAQPTHGSRSALARCWRAARADVRADRPAPRLLSNWAALAPD